MQTAIREFGSEFDWKANDAFFAVAGAPQLNLETAETFRSGRDAMKAVAAAVKDTHCQVLLPALCCESMVLPFVMHGIKPVFYKMRSDYTADPEDVQQKLTEGSVLVYGSYFGIDPFDDETLERLHGLYPKALFMEDRTQDILAQRRERSFVADVTVASIRKWIPVPDGGLLWSSRSFQTETCQDDRFAKLRKAAMEEKSEYLQKGDGTLKDSFRHKLGEANECLDRSATPHTMTEESRQLLAQLDFEKIYACRQANAKALQKALGAETENLRFITRDPAVSTLYFPILVQDQGKVQSTLAQAGIYCPVIWPVPEPAVGVCPVADFTAAHMLGVPCDQRYTPEDMAYIGQQIVRIVHE